MQKRWFWGAALIGVVAVGLMVESSRQARGLVNRSVLLAGLEVAYCTAGSSTRLAVECVGKQRGVFGGHVDTLMVVTVQPDFTVRLLSIPRDTRVPGTARRINASLLVGGMEGLLRDVQLVTGIEVDRHMLVDTRLASEVMGALGGLDVVVPAGGMRWVDRAAGVNFSLGPGRHHLNGEQAVLYLRVRKGAGDDYGRTGRQREAIMQLAGRLMDWRHIPKWPWVAQRVMMRAEGDVTWQETLGWVRHARKPFRSVMLPVREMAGSGLLEVNNKKAVLDLLGPVPLGGACEVVNSSGINGLGRALGGFLAERGLKVLKVRTGDRLEGRSQVFGGNASLNFFLNADMLPKGRCVIVLGKDFPARNSVLFKALM